MTVYDYLLIGLTLLLFQGVNAAALCYSKNLNNLHYPADVFRLMPEQLLQRLDKRFKSRWLPPVALTLLSFCFFPFLQWSALDPTHLLRSFIFFLCAIPAWEGSTRDIDLATNQKNVKERLLLLACFAGLFIYPGFLIPFLFIAIHFLGCWHHHQVMLLRVLQMFLAFLAAVAVLQSLLVLLSQPPANIALATPLFLIISMIASHYFVPGVAKLTLGKQWYSWIMNNHLHHLVIIAYMWGWLSFIPEQRAIRIVNFLKRFDRPLQLMTVLFECGWLFAGFSYYLTLSLCAMDILFHLIALAVGGIFFWESTLVNLALIVALQQLPESNLATLFNAPNALLFATIQLLFPLRKKIWNPQQLAWFDTPFMGKIEWKVIGESGKQYRLHPHFMLPHERLFALNYHHFLSHEKTFWTRQGEVKDEELYDAVMDTKGDRNAIEILKEKYGRLTVNPKWDALQYDHMRRFFQNFNKAIPKSICPKWLRAPGGLYFYWGPLDSFKGQERVVKVIATYVEKYFAGDKILIVREKLLKVIAID